MVTVYGPFSDTSSLSTPASEPLSPPLYSPSLATKMKHPEATHGGWKKESPFLRFETRFLSYWNEKNPQSGLDDLNRKTPGAYSPGNYDENSGGLMIKN